MEVRYYLWSNMAEPETLSLFSGTVCIYSAPRPGEPRRNEDGAMLVTTGDGRTVLAVADGAGGHRESDRAASLALRALGRQLEHSEGDGDRLRDAILGGIEAANRVLLRRGSGAGTTIAVAQIAGGDVRTYHVGDSQILVTGQRGRIKMTSVPHSPTGYAVEAGMIAAEDALHHDERHLISNLVGSSDMHVEVRPDLRLAPRDTLLLASDGLFDNLRLEEIVSLARKDTLPAATRRLAELCRERMREEEGSLPSHADDLTIVLYRGATSPAPPP